MKLLPIILQGKAVKRNNRVILRAIVNNPLLYGITASGDFSVKTTYNGVSHVEQYPQSTTTLSISADANTFIYIFGEVTEIRPNRQDVFDYIGARSDCFTMLSFNYGGSSSGVLKIIDFMGCNNIQTITANEQSALETLKQESPALLSLSFSGVIKTLDLGKNPNLQSISTRGASQLSSIDMSKNNSLTSIDFASVDSLKDVVLPNNPENLTNFKLTGSHAIETLSLGGNSLTTVNISFNTVLKTVTLPASITELNVSGCLSLDFSLLSSLVNLTKLEALQNPNLTRLDLGFTTSLTDVDVRSSGVVSFDAADNAGITNLNVSYCDKLESLLIGGCPSITSLTCDNCPSVNLIKFRATDFSSSEKVSTMISSAESTDGVIYLNSGDSRYNAVSTAATTKGWTVEPLA